MIIAKILSFLACYLVGLVLHLITLVMVKRKRESSERSFGESE